MMTRLLLPTVIASLCLSAPAQAENVVADIDRLVMALQDAGYRAKVETEETEPHILSAAGGHDFTIWLSGCDAQGEQCQNVLLAAMVESNSSLSLEAMNEFSAQHRWGRYYFDHEGNPSIELDINLAAGGMSDVLFADTLRIWESALMKFARFVRTGEMAFE